MHRYFSRCCPILILGVARISQSLRVLPAAALVLLGWCPANATQGALAPASQVKHHGVDEGTASHLAQPASAVHENDGKSLGAAGSSGSLPPDTFSILVRQLPVEQLIFALARDAGINVDIFPGLHGRVSLKASHQTLPQILERIAAQVPLRYRFSERGLAIGPDLPYVRDYTLDYVNMERKTRANVSISTSLASAGGGAGAATSSIPNASSSLVENVADHRLWKTLEQNLHDLLQADAGASQQEDPLSMVAPARERVSGVQDAQSPATPQTEAADTAERAIEQQTIQPVGTSRKRSFSRQSLDLTGAAAEATSGLDGAARPFSKQRDAQQSVVASAALLSPDEAFPLAAVQVSGHGALSDGLRGSGPDAVQTGARRNVIVIPEAGLVSVRATHRQHRRVEQFLARVQAGISRQVLIEATLVEVLLDKAWQTGVDWSRIGRSLDNTLNIVQNLTGNAFGAGPVTTVTFNSDADFLHGSFSSTLKLLETFGEARVLSSPKVTALNNQMALLKVVDEKVYFEIKATRTETSDNGPGRVDYSSALHSVPVGVMMSVTPQIGGDGRVSLNIRPTITRITSYKVDPVSVLIGAQVSNLVPEIQIREIESTLSLHSGQTAVLGGLMQETSDDARQGIPILMHLPLIGRFFSYRSDSRRKTELLIFLRPTIVSGTAAETSVVNDGGRGSKP